MKSHEEVQYDHLVEKMASALRDHQPAQTEEYFRQICEMNPVAAENLTLPVLIMIQKGQTADALQMLNDLPEDRHPELKALCLYEMGDPTWQSLAESLQHDENPVVSKAMQQLLGHS